MSWKRVIPLQHITEHDLMHLSLLQVKLLYSEHCLANTKIQNSSNIFGEIFQISTQCVYNVLILYMFWIFRSVFFRSAPTHSAFIQIDNVTPGSCPGLSHSLSLRLTQPSFLINNDNCYSKTQNQDCQLLYNYLTWGIKFRTLYLDGNVELKCYLQPLTCWFSLMSYMMLIFMRQAADTQYGEFTQC